MAETQQDYVGSAEIASPSCSETPEAFAASVVAARHLAQDINAAAQSATQNVFSVLSTGLREATTAAYPLYLQILADRKAALKAIAATPPYNQRQRAPKGDAATIALTIATVPSDRGESSLVSDYRCFLILAGQKNVAPEEYSTWLKNAPPLKDVISSVRSQREKAKTAKDDETQSEILDVSDDANTTASIRKSNRLPSADGGPNQPSVKLKPGNYIRVSFAERLAVDGKTHWDVDLPSNLARRLASRMGGKDFREDLREVVQALASFLLPPQRKQLAAQLRQPGKPSKVPPPVARVAKNPQRRGCIGSVNDRGAKTLSLRRRP